MILPVFYMKGSAHKSKRWDLLLVAFFLLLSAALYFLLRQGQTAGAEVLVRVNGQETARYSLAEEGEYALNGGSNILVISGGEAWLREANCPDKLCVRQGKIHLSGQTITCLPNKLTVTVVGGEQTVDVVVG